MPTRQKTDTLSKPPALVVGTGFGCRVHVPALRGAGFDVAGLVGADPGRTRQRAEASGVPLAFTDLDEAITRTRAVAVTIATPPHAHAQLAMTAISRGCHVLCEKPLARDVREAQTMLAAAERAGVAHLVGHEFRWRPERALIARAIAAGMIGEPRLLTLVQYMSLIASPDATMPSWWFDIGAGGGWLGASGSHSIDQVRAWLGEFASVSAALPTVAARKSGAEDSFAVRFRLANGVEGIVQQTAAAWGPPADTTRIAGTEGALWLEGSAVWLADRKGPRELPIPSDLALAPAEAPAGKAPQPASVPLFIRLCEALRAAMEGHAPAGPVPVPTFADGVACMKVLDAIRVSAAEGGAVVAMKG
jgi:predicted dehydrogenase